MIASRGVGLIFVVALLAGGCGDVPSMSPGLNLARSDEKRETAPNVTDWDFARQMAGNRTFAFDLYGKARLQPGNVVFSPQSISLAMAMLEDGAMGTTEAEINSAMHFVLPSGSLHPAFNRLILSLASRSQGAGGGSIRLNLVNAMWAQQGFAIKQAYLDTLAKNYGAGLRLLDFKFSWEQARREINQWVAQQTDDRIEELLQKGDLNKDSRLVLTNAILFGAAWQRSFHPLNTVTGDFYTGAGGMVKVKMMYAGGGYFPYFQGDGFQAVRLDYKGRELSMLLLLPAPGKLEALEKKLTASLVDGVRGYASRVNLTLPRFSLEHRLPLKALLQQLGVKEAFTDSADLTGIHGAGGLAVTAALHQTTISVDEKGTVAAAASAVVAGYMSDGPKTELVLDRPFLFLIQDHKTGAILFMGRVSDPS